MKSKIVWYTAIINVDEVYGSNTQNTPKKLKIKGWAKLYYTNANKKSKGQDLNVRPS